MRALFILFAFYPLQANADQLCDVTLRHHDQWTIAEKDQKILIQKFGPIRVVFDSSGNARPLNLPVSLIKRWEKLYEICMRDGCYLCDNDVGSCETGTCGPSNKYCKPYLNVNGIPECGKQCADYASMGVLQ